MYLPLLATLFSNQKSSESTVLTNRRTVRKGGRDTKIPLQPPNSFPPWFSLWKLSKLGSPFLRCSECSVSAAAFSDLIELFWQSCFFSLIFKATFSWTLGQSPQVFRAPWLVSVWSHWAVFLSSYQEARQIYCWNIYSNLTYQGTYGKSNSYPYALGGGGVDVFKIIFIGRISRKFEAMVKKTKPNINKTKPELWGEMEYRQY